MPVAIGGIGGSGTRVIAQLLLDSGVYLGADLNASNDNLWAVLLFNHPELLHADAGRLRHLIALFVDRMENDISSLDPISARLINDLANQPHRQHSSEWISERIRTFTDPTYRNRANSRWGWKSPPIHMFADQLLDQMPGLIYVHVRRNGLDMAFSSNQNQRDFWGPAVLERPISRNACNSLAFWCYIERRILELAKRFANRVHIVDFDRFCRNPEKSGAELLEACNIPFSREMLIRFADSVKIPSTMGRYKNHSMASFDPGDLRFVRHLYSK